MNKTAFERTPHQLTYARIKIDDAGCCPLLTKDDLCQLHQVEGEKHLPFVCKTYPRFQDVRSFKLLEQRMTLACPEVVRLICFDPDAMSMNKTSVQQEKKYKVKTPIPFYFDAH